jgi:hypothetical protein
MFHSRVILAKALLCMATLGLPLVAGCSGNPNEDEFLKTAPPGLKSEFPNESYAERRERTRTKTSRELQAEAKKKGAEAQNATSPKTR